MVSCTLLLFLMPLPAAAKGIVWAQLQCWHVSLLHATVAHGLAQCQVFSCPKVVTFAFAVNCIACRPVCHHRCFSFCWHVTSLWQRRPLLKLLRCCFIVTCKQTSSDNFVLTNSHYRSLICDAVVFSSQITRRLMPSLVCCELIKNRRKKCLVRLCRCFGACYMPATASTGWHWHCSHALPATHLTFIHSYNARSAPCLLNLPQQNIAVISYLHIVAALTGAVLLGNRPLSKPLAGAEYWRFGRHSRQPSLDLQICSIQTPK